MFWRQRSPSTPTGQLHVSAFDRELEGKAPKFPFRVDKRCRCRLIIDPECLESARITAKEYADVRQDLSLLESVSFG